jgi:hypothetical protein
MFCPVNIETSHSEDGGMQCGKINFTCGRRQAFNDFSMKEHSNRVIQNKVWKEISKQINVSAKYCLFYQDHNTV